MYRLGKLIKCSLQQEVLFWTLIGLSVTALEVFFPSEQHRKLLKTSPPMVVNVNVPNQPIVVNIKDPLGNTPVVVNITHGLDKTNPMEKVTLNVPEYTNPTVVVETSQPEKIESKILPKDQNNSFIIFDFYTLRIYFLTYITLLYPVCVESKELLATPWIVVAGLRIFTPYAIFRIYFWIVVYGYWIWLMDKKIQRYHGVPPEQMKPEPWQKEKKDEDLETRENRRRAKGIRVQVARMSPSEVLGKPTSLLGDHLHFATKDLLDSVVCDLIPCSGVRDLPPFVDPPFVDSQIETIVDEKDEKEKIEEEELIKRREERKLAKNIHRRMIEPIRVSDCILRQLSNLLLKLVKQADKEIVDEGIINRDSEIDIFRYYFSHSPDAAAAFASQPTAFLNCPTVSKPRYLLDYPNIFGRGSGGMLTTDSSRSFRDNSMFFHRSDESLRRKYSLIKQIPSIPAEELTENVSMSSVHEKIE